MSKSPFHSGELAIQNKYGVRHNPVIVEKLLKDHISNRYVPFIKQQSTVIIGTTDENGMLWTSMLFGANGFVKVVSPKQIDLDLDNLKSTTDDILFENIRQNSKIGILLIDTATRSRYRLNGSAILGKNRIEVTVAEAYPNCPKYIQQRIPVLTDDPGKLGLGKRTGSQLNNDQINWIKHADTFFMSSRNADGDMDASHRGGSSGFIEILEDDTLKIPDYVGNNLFNSFGNFMQVPQAGLLFMDFEKGHALQLSGEAKLLFDQESSVDMQKTAGTGRYWFFKTLKWIQTPFHNNIDWQLISFSPFNPRIITE